MSVFRFKRFSVSNDRSAMKVNTDGVLLGALMTVRPEDSLSLDIGTGTGTIALMAAQRIRASHSALVSIRAIDSDALSAEEAAGNFRNSPWPDILSAIHVSLQEYSEGEGGELRFDHIFSNPPYFDEVLKAPESRRRAARHSDTLSYRDIIGFSATALADDGILSLILPAETETDLRRHAAMYGLYLSGIVRIRTTERKAPSRIVAEFSRHRSPAPSEAVLTLNRDGAYSEEYERVVSDFYLWAKER